MKVDTGEQTVDVGELDVDKADVKYEHPSEKDAKQYSKDHPMPKDNGKKADDDKPWKVNAGKVRLKDSKGKYGQCIKIFFEKLQKNLLKFCCSKYSC